MPKPISWRKMVQRLKLFGFAGPLPGGKHPTMRNEKGHAITIPNPHDGDIDWSLMKRILKQADIDPKDWDQAK